MGRPDPVEPFVTAGAALVGAAYDLSPAARDVLMGAVGLPLDIRRLALNRLMSDVGREGLIDAFAQFIGLANSVVENNREMVEIILITEGGMTDRAAEKANLPTIFGALNGLKIAEGVDVSKTCEGCAFRVGTPANQSASTTCDADWCGHPGEARFLCHAEGLDERGEPTQACAGWAQLRVERKRAEARP
jgi:hypothetical protein